MITINVNFFGQCRELAGTEGEELRLTDDASVGAALALIRQRHPGLSPLEDRWLVAVNEEYAGLDRWLSDGDTVAVFPPVSGGAGGDVFQITRQPVDAPGLVKQLLRSGDGAVVAFEGVVRDHSMKKAVLYLEYEAYESMALKMMRQVGREVHEKWPIDRIGIVHRVGRLDIGQTSVAIVVTSAHRRPAFEACHYAIDRVKKIVPIWKREYFEDGAVWVEGGSHDELPIGRSGPSPWP